MAWCSHALEVCHVRLLIQFLSLFVLISSGAVVDSRHEHGEDQRTKTVIIVVDGVRWNDLDRNGLEGFKAMAKHGVKARYVNPVYPTNSISNLYSIVTGLYTENHGLVLDSLEDAGDSWSWWRGAEPIWSAAEREDLRAAVHFFPGACHLPSRAPGLCTSGQRDHPTDLEVGRVIKASLKSIEDDQIDLVMVYYGRIKHFGLVDGPDSSTRLKALKSFDQILEELQRNISHAKYDKKVNLVVVSDHGVTPCNKLTPVDLQPFAEMIQLQLGQGAFSLLQPKPERAVQLLEQLKTWQKSVGVQLFKRSQIPDKYRLRRHPRIPPLLLQAKTGYYILPLPATARQEGSVAGETLPAGCHGFDPDQVNDMRTIFLARGPAFLRDHVSEPLWNTDHYNLFCHLLDIAPSPNNGSWDRVARLLDEDDDDEDEDGSEYDYYDEEYGEEDEKQRKGTDEEDGLDEEYDDTKQPKKTKNEGKGTVEPDKEADETSETKKKSEVPQNKKDSSATLSCSRILLTISSVFLISNLQFHSR